MAPSSTHHTRSSTGTSAFTLASTVQQLKTMSLTQFRHTFRGVYQALSEFQTEFPHAECGELTFGVSLADDASIESISDPQYRIYIENRIVTKEPVEMAEYDVSISFWTSDFTGRVRAFQQLVTTAFIRSLVDTNRKTGELPDVEHAGYEQLLAENQVTSN